MTITTEQLDSLISYTRQLADKGSPYAACNHTQLSELLERLKKAEARVAELDAEVRRLQHELSKATSLVGDMFKTDYDAAVIERKRAEAAEKRVAELEPEVRRLTASLAEMRECYIARTADRDRAEAMVAELKAKLNHESYVSNKRALRIEHNQLCAGVGSRCAHLFSERYYENGKLTGTCIYCGVPGLGPAT